MDESRARLPTYFVSHGGGPWPYMKEEQGSLYDELAASLQDMPRQLGRNPRAVLVISGHWEEAQFTVMANARPPMLYDYYGFPERTYRVKYCAAGSPELAERVRALLTAAGHGVRLDAERGFDHGTFVPLFVMYPEANIPVVQLSIKRGFDPAEHFAVGRALAPLRDEGVLILGSGLSYHNLRNFGPGASAPSKAFDAWLQRALAGDVVERTRQLLQWSAAPAARLAHPQEDHLIPLMVAVGAAESEVATMVYHQDNFYGGIAVSSFRFGATEVTSK
jgi:aromatic ring-opening dioxygenase catalytic subunit (LigB family)